MPRTDEMGQEAAGRLRAKVDEVYRSDSLRVFATLGRLLGDLDLAEDALHHAFAAALERWPKDGVPANPRARLVSAGRFKAIDALRRRARFDAAVGERNLPGRHRRDLDGVEQRLDPAGLLRRRYRRLGVDLGAVDPDEERAARRVTGGPRAGPAAPVRMQ